MVATKKTTLYITKNKIWAGDFNATPPKITEYQWNGLDPTEVFKKISTAFKIDSLSVVLGNQLSYVVVLIVPPEDTNREKILEQAKAFIPEDLSDHSFDWKQVGTNSQNRLNIVQVIATPRTLVNALSYAAQANKLNISAIVPISVILAGATKNVDAPHLVLWSGQETLGVVALAGTAYFSEVISDGFGTKINELTSFARDKFSFQINTILLSWQQNPPNFTQDWKVQKVAIDPMALAASKQPTSDKDAEVLAIKPIEKPVLPQSKNQQQTDGVQPNPNPTTPSTSHPESGLNKKLLFIVFGVFAVAILLLLVFLI